MKTKFKIAACFILPLSITLLFSMTGFAVDTVTFTSEHTPHEGDETCIYGCILDEVSSSKNDTPVHEHIPHEGDENCIYSCDHEINTVAYSSNMVWTEEELQSFLDEFEKAESYEDRNAVIIKYYNAPSDFDIREIIAIETSESEDVSVNAFWDELFCDHTYLASPCKNDHYGESVDNCIRYCIRLGVCVYNCGSTTEIIVQEEWHDWSVGYCGQTCKNCGIIEKFHEEGGCSYCS